MTLCTPCSSMTTISPGCTSRTKFALTVSSAQVSDAIDVRRLARERDEPDAERPEPVRVAQRDELRRRDDPARVRADHAGEASGGSPPPRFGRACARSAAPSPRCRARVSNAAPSSSSWRAQRLGVEQVAVVRDRAWTERRVVERQRMGVLRAARAGGRVPRVPERQDRALAHVLDRAPARTPAPPGPCRDARARSCRPRRRCPPTPGRGAAARKGRSR